ncbi:MAG: PGPGW domain-containing protein [Actinomycetota bacterium]
MADEVGDDDHDPTFGERVVEAAVEAEFETGYREETAEEAKDNIILRLGRICLGFIIVILGIIAIPLPGPGWLIVIAGLSILARDFPWAARAILFIRRRIPGVPEDGDIPLRTWLIMGAIVIAATAASIWYTVFDGSETVRGWF